MSCYVKFYGYDEARNYADGLEKAQADVIYLSVYGVETAITNLFKKENKFGPGKETVVVFAKADDDEYVETRRLTDMGFKLYA